MLEVMHERMDLNDDITHDKNKTYLNLSNTSTAISDQFGLMQNSPRIFCMDGMKSWETEVKELNSALRQDNPMSDVLLPGESDTDYFPENVWSKSSNGVNEQLSQECNNLYHNNWYQNCVQNFCLQDDDGDT